MKTVLRTCLVAATLLAALPARAEVDASLLRTLRLDAAPLDVALSADGQRLFVLVKGGKVLIYSAGGTLEETLDLEAPADGIALSARGDLLYASDGETGTVRVLRLEFVQEISAEGSPVKGPPDAPVAVAVFNDFQ